MLTISNFNYKFHKSSVVSSKVLSSTRHPALKSIQCGFNLYNGEFVDILIVGTNVPKGVPLPVVNKTIWHPAAANADAATKSFPGPLKRLRPSVFRVSPYLRTSTTVAFPDFWVHPSDLSSSVVIPPALFPVMDFHILADHIS